MKRELAVLVKNINQCQPVQCSHTEMIRNFPLSFSFLYVTGPFYIMIKLVV